VKNSKSDAKTRRRKGKAMKTKLILQDFSVGLLCVFAPLRQKIGFFTSSDFKESKT
jgi:hypothetical protein